MQTWLDSWCLDTTRGINDGPWLEHLRRCQPRMWGVVQTVRADLAAGRGCVLDCARAWLLAHQHLGAGRYEMPDGMDADDAHRLVQRTKMFARLLGPFVLGFPSAKADYAGNTLTVQVGRHAEGLKISSLTAGELSPVAIRLDRDLAVDLAGARAPASDEIDAEIARHTWYIDIPSGALTAEGRCVRALFVGPMKLTSPTPGGHVQALAILAERDRDLSFDMVTWPLHGLPIPPMRMGDAPDGYDIEETKRELTDLFRLAVAYRMTRGAGPRREVPHIDPAALAKDANWRRKIKKFSLFRLDEMTSPPDRFGRDGPRGKTGVRLGWRSTVKPHFRWQAHGPRHGLRKLMCIAEHERGPEDAPRKVSMERLLP